MFGVPQHNTCWCMVNKRLLIKNILAHNGECSFFDKKRQLDLRTDQGQGKLLKHICALSNSNAQSDSFVVVGVDDSGAPYGCDFVDDAEIQNLASANLQNAPKLKYENISFPGIPRDKSIGLLTISANPNTVSFKKQVSKIAHGSVYHRIGSKSVPVTSGTVLVYPENPGIVEGIYKYSANSIKGMLDGVFEFFGAWEGNYNPQYIVFKEQYVICWRGFHEKEFFSEVDVQIINEEVRLFFSAVLNVKIHISEDEFKITEYRNLGYGDNFRYYPYAETIISFGNTGEYSIKRKNVFTPPLYPKNEIVSLYQKTKILEKKYLATKTLSPEEYQFWEGIANYYLICYFNGIPEAKQDLYDSRKYLDGCAGQWHTECMEILREYEKGE